MDKLAAMRAFCRIVERGSLVRAASDLGVSAALLSRELKLLEESLGCALITRSTRSMCVTDSGRHFYQEARSILDAVTRVENTIRDGAGAVRGQLKVNAPTSFGQVVITPMLPEFLRAYPDVDLTLALDDRVIDMIEGGFDVSIRIRASMPDSALISKRIGTSCQRIFASPDYLARHGWPAEPKDLGSHKIVGFLLGDHLSVWDLSGPDGPCPVSVSPYLRVGSSLAIRDLLVAGCGIGTLPDFVSHDAEAAGELVCVLPGYRLPQREIFALTASRLGMDPRAAAFLEHLGRTLRG